MSPVAAGLLLCLQPQPCLAQEPLLAKIMEVDSKTETLVVQLLDTDPIRQIIVPWVEEDSPAGIRVGALVRLWPGPRSNAQGQLQDVRITPLIRDRFGNDRTGVRSRLRRGAGKGLGGRGSGRGGR